MLEIRDLHKRFDDADVLRGVSLTIETGEFVTLLGPSGCGKTTMLRIIGGFEMPTEGSVLFEDKDITDVPPYRRRVNTVFQKYALFTHLNVFDNIAFGLKLRKLPKAEIAERVHRMLRLVKMEGYEKRSVEALSGGQQQRIAIARALVNEPEVLLLDEPFSALDSYLRELLQIQVKDILAGYGKDVLLVSHSRDEIYYLCGRTAVMENGKILKTDDTKKLFADPGSWAGAELTGCKNIAEARKTGEYEVEVPDWGIRLRTGKPVKDHVCAVGLRAHYFNPKARENIFPVSYASEKEEPFEMRILFRYAGQKEGTPDLWWRLPKDRNPRIMPEKLGIAPQNVLLLYPEQIQEDEI